MWSLLVQSSVQDSDAAPSEYCDDTTKDLLHYALEATPTKMKSTGRSEGCSNNVMTSPVTTKNFKIGPLGDFEKKMFKNFHHPPPSELLSELTHVARIGPK